MPPYNSRYFNQRPPDRRQGEASSTSGRLSAHGSSNPFDNRNFDRDGTRRNRNESRSPIPHRNFSANSNNNRNSRGNPSNSRYSHPPRYYSDNNRSKNSSDRTPNLARGFERINAHYANDPSLRDEEHAVDRVFNTDAVLRNDPNWGPNRKRRAYVPGGSIAKKIRVEEFEDVHLRCDICQLHFRAPSEKAQHDLSKSHNDMKTLKRAESIAQRRERLINPYENDNHAASQQNNRSSTSGAAEATGSADLSEADKDQRRKRRKEMLEKYKKYVSNFNMDDCPSGFRDWATKSLERAKTIDVAMLQLVQKEVIYRWGNHYHNGTLRKKSWSREPLATGEDLRLFEGETDYAAPVIDAQTAEAIDKADKAASAVREAAEQKRLEEEEEQERQRRREELLLDDGDITSAQGGRAGIGAGNSGDSNNRTRWINDKDSNSVAGRPDSINGVAGGAGDTNGPDIPLNELVVTNPRRNFNVSAEARQLLYSVRMDDINDLTKFYAYRTKKCLGQSSNSTAGGASSTTAMQAEAEKARKKASDELKLREVIALSETAERMAAGENYDYSEVFGKFKEAVKGLCELGSRPRVLRRCLRQQVGMAIQSGEYPDLVVPLKMLMNSLSQDSDWNKEKESEFIFYWLISLSLVGTTKDNDVVLALRASDQLMLAEQMRRLPKRASESFGGNEGIFILKDIFANNWYSFFKSYNGSIIHTESKDFNTKKMLDCAVDFMRERALATMLTRNRVGERAFSHHYTVKTVASLPLGDLMDWLGYEKIEKNHEGTDHQLQLAKEFISNLPPQYRIEQEEQGRGAFVVGNNTVGRVQRCNKMNVPLLLEWMGGYMEICEPVVTSSEGKEEQKPDLSSTSSETKEEKNPVVPLRQKEEKETIAF